MKTHCFAAVSGAKLKLGKFAIKLVGGGANIRNTDEFSLPYIQLIQLAIQVIIHHPIDIMNLGRSNELVWQVGSKGIAPSQTLSVRRRNLN